MSLRWWQLAAFAYVLVLMLDDTANPHHPPQWFARSEEFAALNPAPFFSEEVVVPPGDTVRFRYAVGIADAGAEAAESLAGSLRGILEPVAVGRPERKLP